MDKIKEFTKDEWLSNAEKRFGKDKKKWKFRCPSCGHIQSIGDFEQYHDKGCGPNTAFFSCIGRWDGHMKNSMGSGKSPCNYTLGGLFNLAKVFVVDENGRHPVFEFANVEKLEVIDAD